MCVSSGDGLFSDPKLCQEIHVMLRRLVVELPPLSLRFPTHVFKSVQPQLIVERLSRSMLHPHMVFHGPKVERVPRSTLKPQAVFCGPKVECMPRSTLKPHAIFHGPQLKVKLKCLHIQTVSAKRRSFRKTYKCAVVWGLGPGGACPHNRHCVWHRSREQPQLGRTAAVE